MLMTRAVSILAVLLAAGAPAFAEDPCMDFKWDVSKERALFAGPARSIDGGTDLKTAPVVEPNHLYRMRLVAQDRVAFVVAPGKKAPADAVHAGIAVLKLPAAGSYRVALDVPVWIDVVSDQSLLKAKDFQGQHACSAPHKIVEFDLGADAKIVLQLSDATPDTIQFTVTASPPRTQ